jgi:hypothetical protein
MFNLHEYMLFISFSAIKDDSAEAGGTLLECDTKIVKKKLFTKKKKKVCENV